jgi:transposase
VAAEKEQTDRIAELNREIAKRNDWIGQRDRRIESLEKENERLREEIEKLQRSAKRQAAPFSRGTPKVNPRRRGRKRGARYGKRASRPIPRRIDRVIEVPAPLYCPDCERATRLHHREWQWQTDIPPIEPFTTEFRIDVARCTACGRSVRGRHPEQTSEATGAAAVQIGARLIGVAATFNKECGVSYGRMAALFDGIFGVAVAPSTLSRALDRLGRKLEPLYEKIGQRVRSAPMLSPDETGWKIGGHRAWLHVAATREDSFYMISRGRGTREACSLIGADYEGTIVRDGWAPYRVFTKARSQSCLAHLLRRTDGLLDMYARPPSTRVWLLKLKRVLQRAIAVRDRRDQAEIGPQGLVVSIGQIESGMSRLLERAPRHEPVQRFVRHLERERHALFTFLHHDAVPATNYLAEQALRPAVVNRKMSGGNNTVNGSRSQAVLMTVLHSGKKRNVNRIALATNALRNPALVTQLL